MTEPLDLSVPLASGLTLANPVMVAAGGLGFGGELAHRLDLDRLGGLVTPSITLGARRGYPPPRLVEAVAGVLSSTGLPNPGLAAVVRGQAPVWATWRLPVLASLAGATADEFGELAEGLAAAPGVAGLELNLADQPAGGLLDRLVPAEVGAIVAAVRPRAALPLLAKLPSGAAGLVDLARAAVEAGADALTIGHGLPGLAWDRTRRRPRLAVGGGTLSGPAIRPLALRAVAEVVAAVSAPVVGCGGISRGADALEYLQAGAVAVQVCTACLVTPRAPWTILEEIAQTLAAAQVRSLNDWLE